MTRWWRRAGLAAGGAGLLLTGSGAIVAPAAAARGWLFATLFWIGLPLGALVLLMIHNLTGGRWGDAIRPPLRATAATLPLLVLAMVPLAFALPALFPWVDMPPEALSEAVRRKLLYLDARFLIGRTVVVLAVFLGIAAALGIWRPAPPAGRRRSVVGLIVFGFAVTVFSTDWLLALEPDFHSTIYAMLEASGEAVGALALGILVLQLGGRLAGRCGGSAGVLLSEDLANLLFGLVLLWVYLSFMQWLIIWSGDLPEEIVWYLRRGRDGWQYVLWLVVLCHGLVPLVGFLNRRVKRSAPALGTLVAVVLFGHFADVLWRVLPAFGPPEPATLLLASTAVLGIGGAVLFLLGRAPRTKPATPDPERRAHA